MGAAPADGGAGPRQTALRVVMLAVLVDYLGVGMMRTMMPFYAQRLGAASGSGATLLGGLEAAYGVGQMGGAAVLGRLSDVWGRRVVLTLSFAGSFVGYTMAGLATMPTLLLAHISYMLLVRTTDIHTWTPQGSHFMLLMKA